jgi:hypothetical protein
MRLGARQVHTASYNAQSVRAHELRARQHQAETMQLSAEVHVRHPADTGTQPIAIARVALRFFHDMFDWAPPWSLCRRSRRYNVESLPDPDSNACKQVFPGATRGCVRRAGAGRHEGNRAVRPQPESHGACEPGIPGNRARGFRRPPNAAPVSEFQAPAAPAGA